MDMLQAGAYRCPRCGAELLINPPPPGQTVIQATTTLRCPVCRAALGQAPTGGWTVSVLNGGGNMNPQWHRWQVRCPSCGRMVMLEGPHRPVPLLVGRGKHGSLYLGAVRLLCPYCGADLGEYPPGTVVVSDQDGGAAPVADVEALVVKYGPFAAGGALVGALLSRDRLRGGLLGALGGLALRFLGGYVLAHYGEM